MINCLIVDDNKMARMALRKMLAQLDTVHVVAECASAMEAYDLMEKHTIDLIFLDIEMPGMSGLEFARQLSTKNTLIVYTTGKSEYAVDAFALNVVDYLLKPIDTARLVSSIMKVREMLSERQRVSSANKTAFFFVRDKSALKKIMVDDVLFFEAMGDYVKIHTREKDHMVHNTLKTIEGKLPPDDFIRVHRSYIVALKKIEHIQDGVITMAKHGIPVAEAYRTVLSNRLNLL